MSVVSWSPFREFDDLFNRYRNVLPASGNGDSAKIARDWQPVANISETEDAYLIKAELPEVERENVHVVVDQGRITISGERSMEKDEGDATQHRIESFYGTFSRSFALPGDASEDDISAETKNGILKVRIPKTTKPEVKPIKIDVG